MCDVCRIKKLNWKFLNGPKRTSLTKAQLHGLYKSRAATIVLCHLHHIQLFMMGESFFLQAHPILGYELKTGAKAQQKVDSQVEEAA